MEARVNPSLARELADILSGSGEHQELACEGPLLVAARMLSHATDDEMTATTVVGVLGSDDLDAFRSLVHGIVQEFGLEATVKPKVGSFSVRFNRPETDGVEVSR
jgi:hypothetical protein